MSVISVLWLCLIRDAGWWWVSNNHRMWIFPLNFLFRIAVASLVLADPEGCGHNYPTNPLISWPTTQWPAFSLLCLISGYSGDPMGKNTLILQLLCCLNRVVLNCSNLSIVPSCFCTSSDLLISSKDLLLISFNLFCQFKKFGEKGSSHVFLFFRSKLSHMAFMQLPIG